MSRALALVAALLAAACGGASGDCGTEDGSGCAPRAARVDLAAPTFSHPTAIDNPLLPVASQQSQVYLGTSDGLPFRAEVTLLPATKSIGWSGQTITALESQYLATVDGRIVEVALDWFAQDDTGAVWYLGEDVSNFEDGVVVDTEGSWQAGRDGPGGMIMPAAPRAGDVYRPENVPDVVFEEVTVTAVGMTVDGPSGAVSGAIVVRELQMDGATEDKTYAPGYGELITGDGTDREEVALSVPTDAVAGGVPPSLAALTAATRAALDAAESADWTAASTAAAAATTAWGELHATAPRVLRAATETALAELTAAVAARAAPRARGAAIAATRAALDLELRHRPPPEIDRVRFELLARQVAVDGDAADAAGVAADSATLERVRDRFAHTLSAGSRAAVDGALADLRRAAAARDLAAAMAAAARLRNVQP